MHPVSFRSSCSILAAIICGSLNAQTVINGDFEDPGYSDSSFSYTPATTPTNPWTYGSKTGIGGETSPWAPSGGATNDFAFLQVAPDTVPTSISQDIVFSSSGIFSISYLDALRFGYAAVDYTVSLTNTLTAHVSLNEDRPVAVNQGFTSVSYTFTIPETGTYQLKFAVDGPNPDGAVLLDNISISAVPEPSTYALILGLFAFAGVVTRRLRNGR